MPDYSPFVARDLHVPLDVRTVGRRGKTIRENLFRRGSLTGIVPYHFGGSRVMGKIDAVIFAETEDELGRLAKALAVPDSLAIL